MISQLGNTFAPIQPAAISEREWKGPVPDPESFTPLETPPDQADIFVSLKQFDSLQEEAANAGRDDKDKK